MTTVFHALRAPPLPSQATASIIDSTGKRYIDACGGAPFRVLAWQPARDRCDQAAAQQLAYAHTSFFTTDVAENWPTGSSTPRRPASNTCISCRAAPKRSRPR